MGDEVRRALIVEWKPKSPFGFGEAGKDRIFLHISNFADRARWPEVGDWVTFVDGQDSAGRPCAEEIVLHASDSDLKPRHLLELLLLLALPILSLPAFEGLLDLWWIIYFCTFTSLATCMHLWFDKRFAISERSRIPEATLHLFELMGGWPGSFLGQRLLRHKVSKKSYQMIFWAIVLVYQLFALDLIFGGLLYNGLHSLGGF
ncbi:DUF1294 domain-containing protein [Haloferula rosea]|uniref:DUF1294 domain-containing protein n=1 Tax=Haloferula rosea TaxID=490093 RepID=A0A934RCY2_9BACT|nr:DUF1294 domain-containing protein [Haloferula rosea]